MIPKDLKPKDFLTVKLTLRFKPSTIPQREINTERLYTTYLTFTNLPDDVIKVFEDLKNQERGH